jgi:hypothetical protein
MFTLEKLYPVFHFQCDIQKNIEYLFPGHLPAVHKLHLFANCLQALPDNSVCRLATLLRVNSDFGHVRLDHANKRKLKNNCPIYAEFENIWFQELTTILELKARGELCTHVCINNINSYELPFWKQY